MAKKPATPKLTDAEQVTEWMKSSNYPLKDQVEIIRDIIKKTDKSILERIKWNAPSYHVEGTDMLTFGPDRKGRILLVFHHPHVVKIKSALLEGDYKDRRLAYFSDAKEVSAAKKELISIVKELVNEIRQEPR